MSKLQNIKRKLGHIFELPTEIITNLPLISVIGSEEFTIENYKGIVEYSEEIVRISTLSGIIKIEGKKLELMEITKEILSVKGTIVKIEYIL